MQLQCNSICGAFLQYSLQYFVPAGTTQWQLGWAHLCSFFCSAIRGPSGAHYAPMPFTYKAQQVSDVGRRSTAYFTSTISIASWLGPSIMIARSPPIV